MNPPAPLPPPPPPPFGTIPSGAPASPPFDLDAAFPRRIAPIRKSFRYRLAMAMVAAAMVVLPALHLALIAGVAAGTWYHVFHDTWLLGPLRDPVAWGNARFGPGATRAAMFGGLALDFLRVTAYVAPPIAGFFVSIFLVRSLFVREGGGMRPRPLRRENEPFLHEFVDRVCDALGAPRPRRIDVDLRVNAGATFGYDFLEALFGRPKLLIGLPIAAGLSLPEFAGVVAHEMGHFSQGTAMRLGALVGAVNARMARMVFHRGRLDEAIESWARESPVAGLGLSFQFVRLCLWLARRIVTGFMVVANLMSAYLLRQMELDADRYETRLAGADVFLRTSANLRLLAAANEDAIARVQQDWTEGRLVDDLPSIVASVAARASDQDRVRVALGAALDRTGFFDTHPSDADRLRSARAETDPPVAVLPELPASVLFRDFGEISRLVTWNFYRGVLGDDARMRDLRPVAEILARHARELEERRAGTRFFRGAFPSWFPFVPSDTRIDPPHDPKGLARGMLEARARMQGRLAGLPEEISALATAERAMWRIQAFREFERAGVRLPPDERAEVEAAPEAANRRAGASAPLLAFMADANDRLVPALRLLHARQITERVPEAGAMAAEAGRLMEALARIADAAPAFRSLLMAHYRARLLYSIARDLPPEIVEAMGARVAGDLLRGLRELGRHLGDAAYPLDHEKSGATLREYILPADIEKEAGIGALLAVAQGAFERMNVVSSRSCARLSLMVEAVDAAMGLAPFPEPPDEEMHPIEKELAFRSAFSEAGAGSNEDESAGE